MQGAGRGEMVDRAPCHAHTSEPGTPYPSKTSTRSRMSGVILVQGKHGASKSL